MVKVDLFAPKNWYFLMRYFILKFHLINQIAEVVYTIL